ncbi:MAG: DEAD/DEAH box helicase [Alphaproteobacteria bacterium]
MTSIENAHPALSQALTKRGYEKLTPVQNAVLDPELGEQDLLVSAQTGSGKTVAFGLACASTLLGDAERFERATQPMALVIAPTRELALQVQKELEWLYKQSGASVISCVGGMDMRTERRALDKGAHIVVGTPGRLRDHIERGYFDTSALRAVILDEADEMLDMGFREELEYILGTAPKQRRTLMFSATVPKSITGLAKRYQNNALRITTKEETKQHLDIEYQAMTIAPNDRENAIINLLRYHEAQNAIIFCGTRAAVNLMKSRLTNRGFSVVAISGELSQNERSNALQSLRDGRANVCVATDVAARGIDLPGLALVIHADLPKNKDILLHRSGRTGRAGCKGVSAIVVPHNWRSRAERLLNNAKINAKWGKPPSIEDITKRDHERFLADPALVEPIKEDEKQAASELLNEYSAEQIAAALLRIHNKQKPAPEELLDFTDAKSDKKKKKHSNFTNSTWVSLSVGREERAEPRWIIPMLCGAGQMANGQIGSIRIHNKETYVELSTECADKLFTLVGEGGTLEKNITVTRLDEEPEAPKGKIDRSRRPNRKSGKKSYENDKARGDKSKSSFKKKRKSYNDDTPQNNTSGDTRSRREKPNDDGFKKKYKSKSDDGFKGKKSKKPFKGEGNKGSSTHPAEKRKAFKNKKKKD